MLHRLRGCQPTRTFRTFALGPACEWEWEYTYRDHQTLIWAPACRLGSRNNANALTRVRPWKSRFAFSADSQSFVHVDGQPSTAFTLGANTTPPSALELRSALPLHRRTAEAKSNDICHAQPMFWVSPAITGLSHFLAFPYAVGPSTTSSQSAAPIMETLRASAGR